MPAMDWTRCSPLSLRALLGLANRTDPSSPTLKDIDDVVDMLGQANAFGGAGPTYMVRRVEGRLEFGIYSKKGLTTVSSMPEHGPEVDAVAELLTHLALSS